MLIGFYVCILLSKNNYTCVHIKAQCSVSDSGKTRGVVRGTAAGQACRDSFSRVFSWSSVICLPKASWADIVGLYLLTFTGLFPWTFSCDLLSLCKLFSVWTPCCKEFRSRNVWRTGTFSSWACVLVISFHISGPSSGRGSNYQAVQFCVAVSSHFNAGIPAWCSVASPGRTIVVFWWVFRGSELEQITVAQPYALLSQRLCLSLWTSVDPLAN